MTPRRFIAHKELCRGKQYSRHEKGLILLARLSAGTNKEALRAMEKAARLIDQI